MLSAEKSPELGDLAEAGGAHLGLKQLTAQAPRNGHCPSRDKKGFGKKSHRKIVSPRRTPGFSL